MFRVAPGSFVLLPRGIPHWHRVSPDAPMRSLVMTTGHFEQYVAACGEPARARELPPPGAPDMGRAAAGERFRIEVLGPPPATPQPWDEPQRPQVRPPQPGDNLAATESAWPRPTPWTVPRATCPTRPRWHSGAKGFSPVNTIDPLPGVATSQPGGYLHCRSLADDQCRLTIMRVTGDQSGKPQLRT
jgi:hypothetical protein